MTYRAIVVADIGFGDAGKGSIVDFLARQSPTAAVIRFNGGAQAGHNVVTRDGRHHTFAQFGAATFVPGVRTHLSRFMLLDPLALLAEAEHLGAIGIPDALARLSVDEQALLVSPFQKAANRIREVLRAHGKHGSCGMGIGETMADSIMFPERTLRARDLRDRSRLERVFAGIQAQKQSEFTEHLADLAPNPYLASEIRVLTDSDAPRRAADAYWRIGMRFPVVSGDYLARLAAAGNLIFEGAQGMLLDEWHGFHPHTTWSTTTFQNADVLLREIGYAHDVEKIGVVRGYFTRHGAGPFPTEERMLSSLIPDPHNGTGQWQDTFRIGWLDLFLARYALAVSGGADSLAVTNLDRMRLIRSAKVCTEYRFEALSDLECAHLSEWMVENGRIAAFSFRPKPVLTDLSYQECLTGLLAKARPAYQAVPRNTEAFFELIERSLKLPISIESWGPKADDKRLRTRLARVA